MFARTTFNAMNPWREMDRIQREMNRLFGDLNRPGSRAYPAINAWTTEDKAIVTAELAGYEPDQLNISVVDQTLTINGERPRIEMKEGETLHRQERITGKFQRDIQMPFLVDAEKVEAKFDKGVLSITLPRAEADKPKKISIKAE